MNIKRKSKGTPEQMLQAFETKINELECVGSVESSTHLDESDDYIDGSDDIFKTGDRVKEKYTDIFDIGTVIEVDIENNRYLVEYDYTDFENPRWEDGSSIEEWTPEFKECYNDGITSSTDSGRQQDYNTLVAQGMSPEEAWAEIENYEYAEDYDDIDASTDITAADEETDAEYLEKLCEYVTVNLDDAGYEATAYIKDGYLVIESMYDSDSQFIQDIEEIEPNWDDLDSDAQKLFDAYVEKYPDSSYGTSDIVSATDVDIVPDDEYTQVLRNQFPQLPDISTTSKIYDDEISILVTLIPDTDYEIEVYYDLDDDIINSLISSVEEYIEDKCDTDNDLYSEELADLFPEYVS